jgi:hypothetical protein
MPTSRHAELDADLAAIIDEVGSEGTWNEAPYKAVVADPRVKLDMQTGGFMPEADFQVKIRTAELPDQTVLASAWNALIDRLRRDQLLGCTVLQRGSWKHPWQVTPTWDPERERWVAAIHPGFVNGLDAEVQLREDEVPPETLECLDIDPRNAMSGQIYAWLTETPQLPLYQWRPIGRDAAPTSVSVSGLVGRIALIPRHAVVSLTFLCLFSSLPIFSPDHSHL